MNLNNTFIGIKETAKMLNVSEQTLRDWEKAGSLVPSHRTPGGHRKYKLSDIETIQKTGQYPEIIYELQYDNLDCLPQLLAVWGSIQNSTEGYCNIGHYNKKLETLKLKQNENIHIIPLYIKNTNLMSQAGVYANKVPYELRDPVYDKFNVFHIYLDDDIKDKVDPNWEFRVNTDIDNNLWTKLPRFIIGKEIVKVNDTLVFRTVFYERTGVM